ncbi:MAG: hypothetical protein MUF12_01935 [Sediminibacterium sp.]|jgi:hypothetical protein|nr:hypothetical protein [Sediminibacterium sp.]
MKKKLKNSGINLNAKQFDFIYNLLNNEADEIDTKDPLKRGWTGGWRATVNCGRGFGKTHILCHTIAISAIALPKARAGLVGLTIRQVSDVILSQSAEIFKQHGLEEYDPKTGRGCYVVNTKPPTHWDVPYQPLRTFDNCLCFANGYTVEFLSVGNIESKRGTNLDQLFIDESAIIKEKHYNKVLRPCVRANKYVYSDTRPGRKKFNHPLHWAIIDFTSAPWHNEGRWIYKTEELQKKNSKKYYFMEGTAWDNIMNLPGNFIKDLEESLDPLTFEVEVKNKRKRKAEKSYYTSFTDKNIYFSYQDEDYDTNRPLEISWDFNGYFTCISIWQEFLETNDFKCIGQMFVKEAENGLLVNKLTANFIEQYSGHQNKRVKVYGDNSGNNKDANRKPYFEDIFSGLRAAKWIAFDEVQTGYPKHLIRNPVINKILSGVDKSIPNILVNGWTAKAMVISLQDAQTFGDNFEKSKASEGKIDIPQEFATHLSDTFDYIVYTKYSRKVSYSNSRQSPIKFRKRK